MINGKDVRKWYRECLESKDSKGPATFVDQFHDMIGMPSRGTSSKRSLMNAMNKPVSEGMDSTGRNKLERKVPLDSISLTEIGRGIFGDMDEFTEAMDMAHRAPMGVPVMEAGGEIVPSQFANISAFNASAIGLLEARLLEAYNKPAFVMTKAVENIPSKLRQLKLIGVSAIGDIAQTRQPGERHVRATLTERYVTTPQTTNRGAAIEVTREAILFDRTYQLMKQAESVGESLALLREYKTLDVVLGIANPYYYNGTNYNTYQASAGTWPAPNNWVNAFPQTIKTWMAFNNILQLWNNMRDPETGQPISITGRDMLVMPANYMSVMNALQADSIGRFAGALTGATPRFPSETYTAANPVSGMFRPIADMTYPYAYKRLTDAAVDGGGAIAAADAIHYAWFGDFKKAFHWNENLPLTTVRANATDYEMADRGLVFALFADEMGEAGVTDPRYVVESSYYATEY